MEVDRRLLILVDDSEATRRAVLHAGRLLGGTDGSRIFLHHVLPPPPRGLLEHGGADKIEEEKEREAHHASKREEWMKEVKRETRAVFDQARADLMQEGVPEESIDESYSTTTHFRNIAEKALVTARENQCSTIVVGRKSFPWYKELLTSHVSDVLVNESDRIAICTVP
jgi:nucleotide-binding universal stress UspA family protein